MTEEEEFFAWLDGELEEQEAARIEARVAADPELQALAAEHRELGMNLRSALEPVMTPMPDAAPARPAPRAANDNRRFARFAAMAAALGLAFYAGGSIGGGGTQGGIARQHDGQLVAAASLDDALTRQLASAPSGDTRIGLTYRDRDGRICRSFMAPAASGLACRDGEHWQVQGLFGAQAQQGDYRMAAGQDSRLSELIDSNIEGEPFDAEAERAAREAGWR